MNDSLRLIVRGVCHGNVPRAQAGRGLTKELIPSPACGGLQAIAPYRAQSLDRGTSPFARQSEPGSSFGDERLIGIRFEAPKPVIKMGHDNSAGAVRPDGMERTEHCHTIGAPRHC
jgi:hypothetical protein